MPGERCERLNALAKIVAASKYLEIAVAKGATFDRVTVPCKVGATFSDVATRTWPSWALTHRSNEEPKTNGVV